jgi:hypothetical protein
MGENTSCYNDPQVIHILKERLFHFVLIQGKVSKPNQPIEKQAKLYPSEGVLSQNNPVDGLTWHPIQSIAASPQ